MVAGLALAKLMDSVRRWESLHLGLASKYGGVLKKQLPDTLVYLERQLKELKDVIEILERRYRETPAMTEPDVIEFESQPSAERGGM